MVIEICDLRFICYLGFVIWNFINMDSKPRSKKLSIFVAILILLAGVLIGGYLVLKSGRGSASQLTNILSGNSTQLNACEPNPSDSNKDSDGDGLKDWQEMQIYHSDPCKPDTDGDGYLDGEEIASGYDPTKKAPGDELPGTKPQTPRPLPQNLTEALKQQLSGQITSNNIRALDQNGQLLSASDLENYPSIQETVRQVIAGSDKLFAPDPIDESQIKTTSDNSRRSIQNYAAAASTAITSIAARAGYNFSDSESQLFLNALEKNDFSELDLVQKMYQDTYEKLKTLTVPSDMLALHEEQLNIFSTTIKIYQAIKEINTDPLKANLALQAYEPLKQQFINWALQVGQFIEAHP